MKKSHRNIIIIAAALVFVFMVLPAIVFVILMRGQLSRVDEVAQMGWNNPIMAAIRQIPGGDGSQESPEGFDQMQTSMAIVDSVSPGETRRHEIIVERADRISFTCFSAAGLKLAVTDPNGVRTDSASSKGDQTSAFMNVEIMDSSFVATATFGNPAPGKWIVEVEPGEGIEGRIYYILSPFYEGSELNVSVLTDKDQYQKGDKIIVTTLLARGSEPVLGADVTAYAWIETDREHIDTLTLFDDGTHGDRKAGDGQYSNTITNTESGGFFNFSVKAEKGGSEPFSRLAYTAAAVSSYRARFTGIFSDYASDTNGDSLFDELVVKAGFEVIDSAWYILSAQLRMPDGPNGKPSPGEEYIESMIDNARAVTFLTAGTHEVLLTFDGEAIYDKHRDGPYQFEGPSAIVEDSINTNYVDHFDGVYLTKKYSAWDFQGRGIVDLGNYSDRAIDIDGDGLYDSLVVGLDVDIRTADDYVWQATLFGTGMERADFTMGEGPLRAGKNRIEFTFRGSEIRQSGQDGPYEIFGGVAMYGKKHGANITDSGTIRTRAYKHTQFE